MAKKQTQRTRLVRTGETGPRNDPFTTAQKHLARAAGQLESFARGVPLVFTKRIGNELWATSGTGPYAVLYPDPNEVLDRFCQAINSVQDCMKAAGCVGPDGQQIRDDHFLDYQSWGYFKSPSHHSMAQLLTLGQAVGTWWTVNRRQGVDPTHGSFKAIDHDAAEFARAAAAEATALAVLLGINDLADGTAMQVAQLETDTAPLSMNDGKWLTSVLAARLDQVRASSLATYRCIGLKNADGSLGRDNDGRVWRRQGKVGSPIWYLRSTLKSKRGS